MRPHPARIVGALCALSVVAAVSFAVHRGVALRGAVTGCGNGVKEGAEQCDDGNTANGDGCNSSCAVEAGWSCSQPTPPAAPTPNCSDGIDNDGDGKIDGLRTVGTTVVQSYRSAQEIANAINSKGYSVAVNELGCGYAFQPANVPVGKDGLCIGMGYDGGINETCLYSACGAGGTPKVDANVYWSGSLFIREDCGSFYTKNNSTWHNYLAAVDCVTKPACSNGKDDDGDGYIDYPGDTGCANSLDSSEAPHDLQCDSGTVENPPAPVSQASICTNLCGNGAADGGEQCDDGNKIAGDGCSSSCTTETGFSCVGTTCTAVCGDGQKKGVETCDDSNLNDGDGCSSACSVEPGFACQSNNKCAAICGNSRINGTETCDDGNTTSGDGCSSTCALEAGYACTGESNAFRTVQNTQMFSCTLDGNGNCHYPNVHHVECPSGFKPISGSCSIQSPGTTKTGDAPTTSGWDCRYGEYGLKPGAVRSVTSTAEVTCMKEDPSWGSVQTVQDSKTLTIAIDAGRNGFTTPHVVTCPSGTTVVGGSCSIGGWDATKVGEIAQNNGYSCGYAVTAMPPNTTYPVQSTVTAFCLSNTSRLTVSQVTNSQIQSLLINSFGAAMSQPVSASCAAGSFLLGGSCSTGGWHTTKPVDRSNGDSWMCQIAEFNYPAYAGQSFQLGNTPQAACVRAAATCGPVCGDGLKKGSEACDDGNTVAGDGCSPTCTTESGFSCQGSTCAAVCGDGLKNGAEACDDANKTNGDGCSSTCTVEAGFVCAVQGQPCTGICGDGQKKGAETCDDGNTTPNDGCSAVCAAELGWTCANTVCTPKCGDGLRKGDEQCDDTNTASGDGCSSTCKEESGWSCGSTSCVRLGQSSSSVATVFSVASQTPVSSSVPVVFQTSVSSKKSSAAASQATTSSCGNAFKDASEACDDGNLKAGDGCDATCHLEPGWLCAGTPSQCLRLPTASVSSVPPVALSSVAPPVQQSSVFTVPPQASSAPAVSSVQQVKPAAPVQPVITPPPQASSVMVAAVSSSSPSVQSSIADFPLAWQLPVASSQSSVLTLQINLPSSASSVAIQALPPLQAWRPTCGNGRIEIGEECDGGNGCDAGCHRLVLAASSSAQTLAANIVTQPIVQQQQPLQVAQAVPQYQYVYPVQYQYPATAASGPGSLAIMAAGAAAGMGIVRRRRR